MNEIDWKTEILPFLEQIRDKGVSIDLLRKLFIEKLNYNYADQETLFDFPEGIKNNVLSTRIIIEKNDFKVIFCKIDTLSKGIELPVVRIISGYYPANIIIFTDRECSEAHFINTKYVGKEQNKKVKGFRRITVGKTDRLRTAAERLSSLYADMGISTLALMQKCVEAFDVEAVSVEFYKEFVEKYKYLRKVIQETNNLPFKDADELTQNILNRLLFLYFIQKKGWLNNNYKFIYDNFNNCKSNGKEYYKEFLIPIFKKLSDKDFSAQGFENIPFLNGGLFEFHPEEAKITIPNSVFDEIFKDLLERFNFTVREDTEYEEEVAIDPEMLGRIFEQLILSVEANEYKDIPDPRRESGSYYTPRFIVSFMVKQSLFNYLVNEFPSIPKGKLENLVFDSSAEEISNSKPIKDRLLGLKIVDPGVGSGAFTVEILNRLMSIIEALNRKLEINEDRYNLRKKLIENCIYGVDIQDRAVHIARLRLWLSLIVDLDVQKVKDIPPLINLDFKIVEGNSLESKIYGFKFDAKTPKRSDQKIIETIEKYKGLKDEYSKTSTEDKKKILKEKIYRIKHDIAIWHLESIKKQYIAAFKNFELTTLFEKTEAEKRREKKEKEAIQQKIAEVEVKINQIKSGQAEIPFNWHIDFFEVIAVKDGFDIVIANPPYGVDVEKEIYQDEFGLASKDSYGVFSALGMDMLKPGGTLCYIMSDTWQTIRTHYELRKKLYEGAEAQYLISVPMRTFKATVNTGIYLFKKSSVDNEKDNFIIAADFHNLDIKKGDLEAAFDLVVDIEPDEKCTDGYTIISDKEMAIYAYRQKIIGNYSNLSYFIASPKLFKLMQDTGNLKPKPLTDEKGNTVMFNVEKQKNLFEKEGPDTYLVNFNGKEAELVKLGSIAEVKQGLATGDNDYYLRKLPGTRGSYQEIDLNLVLKEDELGRIRDDEKLRKDIIENGICTNSAHKTHQHRYFEGRYFVPFDKGGESDVEEGWLPNYYVPTTYFIDWSEKAVKRMKTLTIADAHRSQGKAIAEGREYYENQVAAVFRNTDFYFKEGISFSQTGYYAPMFRIKGLSIFDVTGSSIFSSAISNYLTIGVLASRFVKLLSKCFIDSTVHFQVDEVKKIPIVFSISEDYKQKLTQLVSSIISHQKQNPRYDYMVNEQIEIDKLVYEMYNLNEEDIQEVENWYFRRYPKLAQVVKEKLNGANNGSQKSILQ